MQVGLGAILLRLFWLWFQFSLTKHKVMVHLAQRGYVQVEPGSRQRTEERLAKLSNWEKNHMPAKCVMVLELFWLLVYAVFFAVSPVDPDTTGDICTGWWTTTWLLLIVSYIIGIAVFAWQMRGEDDVFRIKRELWVTGKYGILLATLWIIVHTIVALQDHSDLESNEDRFPFEFLFGSFAYVSVCLCQTAYPVYMAWQLEIDAHNALKKATGSTRRTSMSTMSESTSGSAHIIYFTKERKAVPSQYSTLDNLLRTKPGRQSFESHLVAEFSVESLYFLESVARWKFRLLDRHARHLKADGGGGGGGNEGHPLGPVDASEDKSACSIFTRYLSRSAPMQVNVPSEVFRGVENYFRESPFVGPEHFKSTAAAGGFHGSLAKSEYSALDDLKDDEDEEDEAKETSNFVSLDILQSSDQIVNKLPSYSIVFDAAVREIFELLERDSWTRYTVSDKFEKLVTEYQDILELAGEHNLEIAAPPNESRLSVISQVESRRSPQSVKSVEPPLIAAAPSLSYAAAATTSTRK